MGWGLLVDAVWLLCFFGEISSFGFWNFDGDGNNGRDASLGPYAFGVTSVGRMAHDIHSFLITHMPSMPLLCQGVYPSPIMCKSQRKCASMSLIHHHLQFIIISIPLAILNHRHIFISLLYLDRLLTLPLRSLLHHNDLSVDDA